MLRLKKDMGAIVVVLLLGTTSQGQPALVHLDTAVAFKGQAVTGLTRNDFRIFDDDSQQSIVRFAGEEQPLDILLVFHASSQMVPTIKVIADAAHNGLQELHRGDRVAVMIFDAKSRVVLPLTQDMDAVERTLKNDVPGLVYNGHTTAAAAATRAAEFFLAESNNGRRRSVLHVFSVDVGVS